MGCLEMLYFRQGLQRFWQSSFGTTFSFALGKNSGSHLHVPGITEFSSAQVQGLIFGPILLLRQEQILSDDTEVVFSRFAPV